MAVVAMVVVVVGVEGMGAVEPEVVVAMVVVAVVVVEMEADGMERVETDLEAMMAVDFVVMVMEVRVTATVASAQG